MKNLLLDQATNDLKLTAGNFTFEGDNLKYWSQKLEVALQTFYGEWFLNKEIGLPYFQSILGKTSTSDANAVFQSYIQGLDFVAEIISFDVDYNGSTRKYTINNLSVKLDTGESVTIEEMTL